MDLTSSVRTDALPAVATIMVPGALASYAEYYVIDRFHEDRAAMLERWRGYLRLAWETEPVGQHYLRRILTVFKFELNLLVGTVAGIPAVIALAWYGVLTPVRRELSSRSRLV